MPVAVLLPACVEQLSDCIVDAQKYPNLASQDDDLAQKMLSFSGEGQDQEHGWELYTTLKPEMISVHRRKVPWKSKFQYRSRSDTVLDVRQTFEQTLLRESSYNYGIQHEMEISNRFALFNSATDDGDGWVYIIYRVLSLPWPLRLVFLPHARTCTHTHAHVYAYALAHTYIQRLLSHSFTLLITPSLTCISQ